MSSSDDSFGWTTASIDSELSSDSSTIETNKNNETEKALIIKMKKEEQFSDLEKPKKFKKHRKSEQIDSFHEDISDIKIEGIKKEKNAVHNSPVKVKVEETEEQYTSKKKKHKNIENNQNNETNDVFSQNNSLEDIQVKIENKKSSKKKHRDQEGIAFNEHLHSETLANNHDQALSENVTVKVEDSRTKKSKKKASKADSNNGFLNTDNSNIKEEKINGSLDTGLSNQDDFESCNIKKKDKSKKKKKDLSHLLDPDESTKEFIDKNNHIESVQSTDTKTLKSKKKKKNVNVPEDLKRPEIVKRKHNDSNRSDESALEASQSTDTDSAKPKKKKRKKEKSTECIDTSHTNFSDYSHHNTQEITTQNKTTPNKQNKKTKHTKITSDESDCRSFKTPNRVSISDRIQFEEDLLSHEKSSNEDEQPSIESINKLLSDYVENKPGLNIIAFPAGNNLSLDKDDENWILSVPSEIKIKALIGCTIRLDGKTKIKVDGQTYDGLIEEGDSRVAVLTSNKNKFSVKNIKPAGTIRLRKRIPRQHINDDNILADKNAFIPLPETKKRHPLFGHNYTKFTKIPITVAKRLETPQISNTVHKKGCKSSEDAIVKKKKKKKRKISETEELPEVKPKKVKKEPDYEKVWDSEKAIEENLFDF